MSVASSSGVALGLAEIMTPESACTALRVEATRAVVCSCAEQLSGGEGKLHRLISVRDIVVSRGCGDVESACGSGDLAGERVDEAVDWRGGSLSGCSGRAGRALSAVAVVEQRWHSFSTASRELSSEAMRAEVRRQACRTVVWSRPPNCRPIAGSDSPVSSRARYMATCRGQAMRAARELGEELARGRGRSARRWRPGSRRRCAGCVRASGACGIEAVEDLARELGGERPSA